MFTEVPSAMGNCLLHSIHYWARGRGGKLIPMMNIFLSFGLCTTFAELPSIMKAALFQTEVFGASWSG
jgi:hypothetical protein